MRSRRMLQAARSHHPAACGDGRGKFEPGERAERRYGHKQRNARGRVERQLPTVASNSDFGGESVAISGQAGQVSPLAGAGSGPDQRRA